MHTLLRVILLVGLIAFVKGFSSGVPPTASVCKQMVPGHHSTLLTTTPECFLNVSETAIKSGNTLTVTLTAVGDNVFKGYYIQARNEANIPIGTFTTSEITKAHSCGGIRNNAAHHSGNNPKKSVPIVWQAPSKYTGTVKFMASCVKDYSNYWVGILSSPVKIEQDSSVKEIGKFIRNRRRKRGFQGGRIMNKPLRESSQGFKTNQDTLSDADTVITGWESQTTNDGSLPVRKIHSKNQHQFTSVATIWKGKPNALTTATKAVHPLSNGFQPLKQVKIIHGDNSRPLKLVGENSQNSKYPGHQATFQGGYGGTYSTSTGGAEATGHPGSQAAHTATNYNFQNHNPLDIPHGHGYIPKEKFAHPKPEKGFQPLHTYPQTGYENPTHFQSVITPGADFHRNPLRPFPYDIPPEVAQHIKENPGHKSFHLPRLGYLVFNPRRGPPFYIITVPEPSMNSLSDMFNVYEYHPGNYRFGRRRPMMPFYRHG